MLFLKQRNSFSISIIFQIIKLNIKIKKHSYICPHIGPESTFRLPYSVDPDQPASAGAMLHDLIDAKGTCNQLLKIARNCNFYLSFVKKY